MSLCFETVYSSSIGCVCAQAAAPTPKGLSTPKGFSAPKGTQTPMGAGTPKGPPNPNALEAEADSDDDAPQGGRQLTLEEKKGAFVFACCIERLFGNVALLTRNRAPAAAEGAASPKATSGAVGDASRYTCRGCGCPCKHRQW